MTRAWIVGLALLASGCAAPQPPRPWERGDLARREMQPGADLLDRRFESHWSTSREAASGGNGVGGGGCGCN